MAARARPLANALGAPRRRDAGKEVSPGLAQPPRHRTLLPWANDTSRSLFLARPLRFHQHRMASRCLAGEGGLGAGQVVRAAIRAAVCPASPPSSSLTPVIRRAIWRGLHGMIGLSVVLQFRGQVLDFVKNWGLGAFEP